MADLAGGGGGWPWPAVGGGGGETLAAAIARRVPHAAAIRAEAVRRAERAAREVVRRVQPTAESERRREGVIEYARKLVGASIGCEVFAFGSVPLKTYLPDGDVDLTVLGNTSYDSTLINDVRCILESEEQNSDAEFEVKDVQYIHAEVRLIKCIIENIIVDISFNQTGGVCTLCFLELVDRHVGKNHLFKRSIILIKAWCYHESRILGAHHGLISTYALETLVLYIFNLFHKSLHGPLEVLYRFLEYFSKFDWDNYCISLHGPVALSSLPNLIVEATDMHGDDLLLDKEFFKGSEKLFAPPRDSEGSYTKLRLKHLNIIDPLKENNNLGRSVSRANFYRIRSAFSYGAQKLGQILMLPSELIPDEVYSFFMNTLERHGRGERPDLGNDSACQPFLDLCKTLREDISNMKISNYINEDENKSPLHPAQNLASKESNVKTNGHNISGKCLSGDAQDHTRNKIWGGKSTTEDHKVLSSTGFNAAPKLHSSFCREDGNGNSKPCSVDYTMEEEVSHSTTTTFHVDTGSLLQPQIYVNNPSHILTSSTRTNSLKFSTSGPTNGFDKTKRTNCHVEKSQLPVFSPSSLSDLSGDLDSHFRCLRQVQYHLEYMFGGFLLSVREASSVDMLDEDSFDIPSLSILLNTDSVLPELSSASSTDADGRNSSPVSCSYSTEDVSRQSQDEDQWDVTCQQNISLPAGTDLQSNGLLSSSSSAAVSENLSSVSWSHSSEDIPRMHGTGTYIPKMSYESYKERMASERARKQIPAKSLKVQNNSQGDTCPYKNSFETGSFGPNKEHVTPESTTKQIPVKQNNPQQDIYPNKNLVLKGNFVPSKERVKPVSATNKILTSQPLKVESSLHWDHCSNKNLIEKRSCDTHKEHVTADSAIKQIPTYLPLKVQNSPYGDVCSNKNLIEKRSYDTHKDRITPDSTTKQIPIYQLLKVQNSIQVDVYSNKNLIEKRSYDNHKEHLTFERVAKKMPASQALKVQNSLQGEVYSNKDSLEKGSQLGPSSHCGGGGQGKLPVSNTYQSSFPVAKGYSENKGLEMQPEESVEFGSLGPVSLRLFSSEFSKNLNTPPSRKGCAEAPASTLQSSRVGATESRPPGFYQLRDEGDFPPLPAGSR